MARYGPTVTLGFDPLNVQQVERQISIPLGEADVTVYVVIHRQDGDDVAVLPFEGDAGADAIFIKPVTIDELRQLRGES